jgi:hypothetical protein
MGVGGHCRVRDVHIRMLVERYRRMLGELNYYNRLGLKSTSPEQRRGGCEVLARAIRCVQPDINLEALAPIRFAPPAPFSSAQLTRAILAKLRTEETPVCAARLADSIRHQGHITFSTTDELNAFSRQVRLRLKALAKQGFLRGDGDLWMLQPFD